MAILRKIKATTLIETLVASVIIVLVFMISSFLLNSLFENTIKNNTDAVKTELSQLIYFYEYNQIELPYQETFEGWEITIEKESAKEIVFEAFDKQQKKTITLRRYAE